MEADSSIYDYRLSQFVLQDHIMSVTGYSSDFDDDAYHANDELRFDDHLGARANASLVGAFAATRIGV